MGGPMVEWLVSINVEERMAGICSSDEGNSYTELSELDDMPIEELQADFGIKKCSSRRCAEPSQSRLLAPNFRPRSTQALPMPQQHPSSRPTRLEERPMAVVRR